MQPENVNLSYETFHMKMSTFRNTDFYFFSDFFTIPFLALIRQLAKIFRQENSTNNAKKLLNKRELERSFSNYLSKWGFLMK